MSLLKHFMSILEYWRPTFCKEEAFRRAKEHCIASLCAFGRHTITNFAQGSLIQAKKDTNYRAL